jgi:hypothetical protein
MLYSLKNKVSFFTLIFTFFVLILVPTYWHYYGPQNFLWLSDVGLFLTVCALWFKSSLLISICVLGILPLEIVWNIDFIAELLTGHPLSGLAHYMFDSHYPLFVRIISLFHIAMPIIWIFHLYAWGYNPKAFRYTLFLIWTTLLLTYLITDSAHNINWVFMSHAHHWPISSQVWLLMLMVIVALIIFCMHSICKHVFKRRYV